MRTVKRFVTYPLAFGGAFLTLTIVLAVGSSPPVVAVHNFFFPLVSMQTSVTFWWTDFPPTALAMTSTGAFIGFWMALCDAARD